MTLLKAEQAGHKLIQIKRHFNVLHHSQSDHPEFIKMLEEFHQVEKLAHFVRAVRFRRKLVAFGYKVSLPDRDN